MFRRIWNFCCSLKLAIVLASAATFLAMAGSVLIVRHPAIFGTMDSGILLDWFRSKGIESPGLSWWVPVAAALVVLLGLNTLCCFIDWMLRFSARWRKSGEYLIHLGFILVVAAYGWGSVSGFRSAENAVAVGGTIAIEKAPGLYLRLDSFTPIFADSGRPVDMISELTLFEGDREVMRGTARFNQPVTYKSIAILPGSFDRRAEGFSFRLGGGNVELKKGSSVELPSGRLEALEFYPNALRRGGKVYPAGGRLASPAFLLAFEDGSGKRSTAWYLLREGLPAELKKAGIVLRPRQPIYGLYSLLIINSDPGAPLALAGGIAMFLGAFLALFSFYYKRARKDRPEID